MANERWKQIPAHPDFDVSDQGRVRRRARVIQYRDGRHRPQPAAIRKLVLSSSGYLTLRIDGVNHHVHRLVAEAFVSGQAPGLWVNHKHPDGDKTRNVAGNLEWVTPSQNMQHAHDVLKIPAPGPPLVAVIATNTETGVETRFPSIKSAGAAGFNQTSVCNCCAGRGATHAGYTWRYADARE